MIIRIQLIRFFFGVPNLLETTMEIRIRRNTNANPSPMDFKNRFITRGRNVGNALRYHLEHH